MIGNVTFTMSNATSEVIAPREDYGILLIKYEVSPPEPKIYRVSIEGRSGTIDMSEWANDIFYDDRTVTIRLRDFNGRVSDFITRLNGKRVRVCFETDDPAYYYNGRVESIRTQKRKQQVTDIIMTLTCDPFKYPSQADAYGYVPGVGGLPYSGNAMLTATIDYGESKTWTPTLYQDASSVTLTISGYDSTREESGNPSVISINGTETEINDNGNIQIATRLYNGENEIIIYNNQTAGSITATIMYQNRVM